MAVSDLTTSTFWRELLERAARQAAQTLLPIVLTVAANPKGFNGQAVALAVVVAVAVTILKSLAGVMVHPDEPWYWQVVDRALPAAAGTAIGFLPVNSENIITVNWANVAYASIGAALVAVVAFYVTPPAAVHALAVGRNAVIEPTEPADEPAAEPADEPATQASDPV